MTDVTLRNLGVLAYTNGFTHWHYKADGLRMDDVVAPGFFALAEDMFSIGDVLLITGVHEGRAWAIQRFVLGQPGVRLGVVE